MRPPSPTLHTSLWWDRLCSGMKESSGRDAEIEAEEYRHVEISEIEGRTAVSPQPRRKTARSSKKKKKAQQERAEHTAKLRALRLAKEAADKEAAEKGK